MDPKRKPSACKDCPAYDIGIGYCGPVRYTDQPDMTFIFDGPGDMESRFSSPVFWKSLPGRTIKQWLKDADIDQSDVQLTNIIRCYLPARKNGTLNEGVRPPTQAEAEFCMNAHLVPTLQETDAYGERHIIITVGAVSARFFRGIKGSVEPHIGVFDSVTDPTRQGS